MGQHVKEEQLLKALSDMEALAYSDGLPTSTADANGGFSEEGDQQELATQGGEGEKAMAKAAKGKKTLAQWAKEHMGEDDETSSPTASKAMNDEAEESEDEESESESMAKKAVDEDEDEESEESESSEATKCLKKKMKKSTISDLIKSDGTSGPIVDASPFIERLVDEVSSSEHDLRKSIMQLSDSHDRNTQTFRKALKAMGEIVLDMKKSLDRVQNLPVTGRKSVLSKSELSERFDSAYDFSKSQILDAMIDLCSKGQVSSLDVSRYETTTTMEPTVRKTVEEFLAKSRS